jgi:cytochrome c oxidase subunit I
MSSFNRLALANIGVAIAAFGAAAAMAVMQALSRANLDLPFRSPAMYYMSMTAHGTLMAIVFTTFFIMGLGYFVAQQSLGAALAMRRTAWASFWIAVVGTLSAVTVILGGKATVLYTFYPPLKAHPAFYIGLTLLVIGSWGWALVMLRALRFWRRMNPGRRIPLAIYGYAATIIVWLLATVGVAAEMLLQLIPWSLGWSSTPSWRACCSGGSGIRSCTSGYCPLTSCGTRCCLRRQEESCSASRSVDSCSRCSFCYRLPWAFTTSSWIQGFPRPGSCFTHSTR